MKSKNIQRAILSTFLWSNDLAIDTHNAFMLDLDVFNGDAYLIASKINEVTQTEDRYYGILNLELENTSAIEWMEILAQTAMPFSVVKRYHSKLQQDYRQKISRGA